MQAHMHMRARRGSKRINKKTLKETDAWIQNKKY